MGAWEELDREFIATNDTSALTELIEVCNDGDFEDIFEPAIQQAEKWITAIETGTEQGLDVIGNKLISAEQTEILDTGKHPYSQGILGTSIYMTSKGDSRLIGTSINHIYPMSVEYGADIYPVNKKYLKFQTRDGDIVFAKKVHQNPKPFVQPAFEKVIDTIENEGYGVFRSVCDQMTQNII